jgi:SH3-like domain-containing protein
MTKKASDEGSRAGNSTSGHRRRAQSRTIGLSLIAAGQRSKPKNMGLVEAGHELIRTGRLKMKSLSARVGRKPRFMCADVERLKRGDWVTVISIHGSWFQVRTSEGKEGFIHSNNFIHRRVRLRSADTHGGSARDGVTGGGRA